MKVLLVLDATNPYDQKVIRGVTTYAHNADGWSLQLMHDPSERYRYWEQDPLEKQFACDARQADGIIAYFSSQQITAALSKVSVPVIEFAPNCGWGEQVAHIPSFSEDDHAIARLAAEDLISRGFKQLAFCGVPETRFTRWSSARERAFQQCAEEAGVPCSVFPVGLSQRRKGHNVHEQLSAWVRSLPKPVGLMACYDVRAFHVLDACHELGLLVPEDVAVIGVDNNELLAELSNPPLSSIEQGAKKIGYQAAALLDRLMAGEKAPELRMQVEPEGLVTRRSSDFWAIEDTYVSEALKFIREHACEGIRVVDIVEAIAVGRTTLESHFRKAMGRTLNAEIQRIQIECVRRLIATTELPLKDIASAAGFNSVQYMTTLFRRHTGQTPGRHRRNVRSG